MVMIALRPIYAICLMVIKRHLARNLRMMINLCVVLSAAFLHMGYHAPIPTVGLTEIQIQDMV